MSINLHTPEELKTLIFGFVILMVWSFLIMPAFDRSIKVILSESV